MEIGARARVESCRADHVPTVSRTETLKPNGQSLSRSTNRKLDRFKRSSFRSCKGFRDPERRNSPALLLLAATAKTQSQCRKWRTPVKIIVILRSLAAAITSLSRTEPPG